jgi:hypothetical protein
MSGTVTLAPARTWVFVFTPHIVAGDRLAASATPETFRRTFGPFQTRAPQAPIRGVPRTCSWHENGEGAAHAHRSPARRALHARARDPVRRLDARVGPARAARRAPRRPRLRHRLRWRGARHRRLRRLRSPEPAAFPRRPARPRGGRLHRQRHGRGGPRLGCSALVRSGRRQRRAPTPRARVRHAAVARRARRGLRDPPRQYVLDGADGRRFPRAPRRQRPRALAGPGRHLAAVGRRGPPLRLRGALPDAPRRGHRQTVGAPLHLRLDRGLARDAAVLGRFRGGRRRNRDDARSDRGDLQHPRRRGLSQALRLVAIQRHGGVALLDDDPRRHRHGARARPHRHRRPGGAELRRLRASRHDPQLSAQLRRGHRHRAPASLGGHDDGAAIRRRAHPRRARDPTRCGVSIWHRDEQIPARARARRAGVAPERGRLDADRRHRA